MGSYNEGIAGITHYRVETHNLSVFNFETKSFTKVEGLAEQDNLMDFIFSENHQKYWILMNTKLYSLPLGSTEAQLERDNLENYFLLSSTFLACLGGQMVAKISEKLLIVGETEESDIVIDDQLTGDYHRFVDFIDPMRLVTITIQRKLRIYNIADTIIVGDSEVILNVGDEEQVFCCVYSRSSRLLAV